MRKYNPSTASVYLFLKSVLGRDQFCTYIASIFSLYVGNAKVTVVFTVAIEVVVRTKDKMLKL